MKLYERIIINRNQLQHNSISKSSRYPLHLLFLDISISSFIFSKPLNADILKPCTAAIFDQESDAFCEYNEFLNSNNGTFIIAANNKFNVRRAKLWNEILEIDY